MTKARSVALVCAGQVSRSGLFRLPALAEQLALVKSTHLRQASRAANALRAGTAVSTYEQLAKAKTFLISVPGEEMTQTIGELAKARITWRGKSVILCDSTLDSDALEPLEILGATPGSFLSIDGFQDRRFVIEGGTLALKAMLRLLKRGDATTIEITRGLKTQFLSGLALVNLLPIPLLAAALDCFRGAGVPLYQAQSIVEVQLNRSMRGYFKAPRQTRESLVNSIRHIQDPGLAELFRQILETAARFSAAKVKSAVVQ
jgi:hypothetical protein